jgi:multidrug efflux system membrane fusion protein
MSVQKPEPPPPEDSPAPFLSAAGEPGKRRRRWPWILAIVIAAVVVLLVVRGRQPKSEGKPGAKGGKQAAPRAVPVVGVAARTGDMGVYMTGLGTVTAISTVTVKSRVDGQLLNVAYREGQLVRKGDLLVEIDPRPFQVQLQQAEGQLAKDEATLRNAQQDLTRYGNLLAQDSISKQQYDQAVAAVHQAEGTIESDRAQVSSARLNLTYSKVTAPTTGRVGLRLVDPGNMVHASDPNGLVVITQLQPIAVVFTVPSDQLPPVLTALHAGKKLAVEAWDRSLGRKLATGTLSAVDNQIDSTTGTVRLKATFDNEDEALFPNLFVNARLLIDTLHGVVIVPNAAIQRSPNATYVWVAKGDAVEMRNVDAHLTEGEETALKKGVTSGEVVVVDGVDKLQQGSKVSLSSPASASAGARGSAAPGKRPPSTENVPGGPGHGTPRSPSAAERTQRK